MTCSDPALPTDDGNLVTRMVRAWCRHHRAGVTDGIDVHIEKRIPMQAGLGGGSADAVAATLVALTMHAGRLVHACDARDALLVADRAMAASLGADVAFFLVGGRALGTGRGEQLRSLDEAPLRPVVVAQPGFGVPTAEAYRWFAEAAGLRPGQLWRRSTTRDGRAWSGAMTICRRVWRRGFRRSGVSWRPCAEAGHGRRR